MNSNWKNLVSAIDAANLTFLENRLRLNNQVLISPSDIPDELVNSVAAGQYIISYTSIE